jgi:hypothetical protein
MAERDGDDARTMCQQQEGNELRAHLASMFALEGEWLLTHAV